MVPLAPACDFYRFSGDQFMIEGTSKVYEWQTVKFPVSGVTVGPGQAEESYYFDDDESFGELEDDGIGSNGGNASGGITGRKIDITVNWTSGERAGTTTTFSGQVDDDGYARGNHIDALASLGPWATLGWRSRDTLSCNMSQEIGGNRVGSCEVLDNCGPLKPPDPEKPPPPPTSEITLRYDPPTSIGITAWVGITNNADNTAVGCTYRDGFNLPRPFTVTGSAESRIDIVGIPTKTVFHVTVTCDNGLTHSEDKEF